MKNETDFQLNNVSVLSEDEMKQVKGAEGETRSSCDPYASYDRPYGTSFQPCSGKKEKDPCSYYRCNSQGNFIRFEGSCQYYGGAYEFICSGHQVG